MPVPMSGIPIRFYINTPSTTATVSTVALTLWWPGTQQSYFLQPYEQLVICAIGCVGVNAGGTAVGGGIVLTNAPASTVATSISSGSTIMQHFFSNGIFSEWHDDGTGAMTGLPGVIPSVLQLSGIAASTVMFGAGLIVNAAPQLSSTQGSPRNPQAAPYTQNINAVM